MFNLKNLFVIFVLLLITSCTAPSYLDFVKRDTNYFKKIADACELLIIDVQKEPNKWEQKIKKDSIDWIVDEKDKTLPEKIKVLYANKIIVMKTSVKDNYRVWIGVGNLQGFGGGYSIVWEQNDNKKGLWELQVIGGGRSTVVYSKQK